MENHWLRLAAGGKGEGLLIGEQSVEPLAFPGIGGCHTEGFVREGIQISKYWAVTLGIHWCRKAGV